MDPFTESDFEDQASPATFTVDDFSDADSAAAPFDPNKFQEDWLAARGRVPAAGSGMESGTEFTTALANTPLVKGIIGAGLTGTRGLANAGGLAMGQLQEGAMNAANLPGNILNTIFGKKPGEYGWIEPIQPQQEIIPNIPPVDPEQQGIVAEAGRLIHGMNQAQNAFLLPLAELKPVQAGFGLAGAASVPQSILDLAQSQSGAEFRGKSGVLGMNLLMGGLLKKSLTRQGGPYARSQQEAAKVYGDLQSQPVEGQGQMPVQEGGSGVLAPTEGVAKGAQVSLSPEDQAYLDAERKAIDSPVELVDKLSDESHQPFASGRMATVRPDGTIEVARGEYQNWLSRVPEAQRPEAVRSMLAEESNHNAFQKVTTPEERSGFWNDMTPAEQRMHLRMYTGEWSLEAAQKKHGIEFTPEQLGYEAANSFQMRLARMTRREVAEAAFREKWTVKTLDNLANLVFKTRESLGTKASKRQAELLDRVTSNLDIARTALGAGTGRQPGSLNKGATKPQDIADTIGASFDSEMGPPGGRKLWQFTVKEEGPSKGASFNVPAGSDEATVTARANRLKKSFTDAELDRISKLSPAEFSKKFSKGFTETTLALGRNTHPSVLQGYIDALDAKMPQLLEEAQRSEDPAIRSKAIQEYADTGFQRQFFNEAKSGALEKTEGVEGVTALDPQSGSPLSATESLINRLETKRGPAALRKSQVTSYDQWKKMLAEKFKDLLSLYGFENDPDQFQRLSKRLEKGDPELEKMIMDWKNPYPDTPWPFDEATQKIQDLHDKYESYSRKHLQQPDKNLPLKFGPAPKGSIYEQGGEGLPANIPDLGPSAVNKRKGKGQPYDPEQLKFLPPVTAKGVPGAETVAPEERPTNIQVPEEAKRIKVSPREIGYDQPYKQPPFRPITASEANSSVELNKVLTSDARIGGSELPITMTKRATVLLNKNDGTVHIVSTHPYRRGGESITELEEQTETGKKMLASQGTTSPYSRPSMMESVAMVTNPEVAGKMKLKHPLKIGDFRTPGESIARVTSPEISGAERPNVPIDQLLPNYKPIYSILFQEPKQNFHQKFDTLADFYKHFGDEAAQQAREHGTGFENVPQEHVEGEQTYERHDVRRPTDAEIKAFHDFFGDELPSDRTMFERKLMRTSANANRQLVNGLHKLVQIERRRTRGLSEGEALASVLDHLYENLTTTDTRQEFIARTMAQSGAAPAEAIPAAKAPTGKELTTLRSRAPTAVAGQVLPRTAGPEPRLPTPTPPPMLPQEHLAELEAQLSRDYKKYGPATSRLLDPELAFRKVPRQRYSMGKSSSIQEGEFEPEQPKPTDQDLFTDREIAEIESAGSPNKPLSASEFSLEQQKKVIAKAAANAGQLDLWQPRKTGQGPAALNKQVNVVKDQVAKHAEEAVKAVSMMKAYINRHNTEDTLSYTRDVVDNVSNIVGDQVEKVINLETASKKMPQGNAEVKAAANAVLQAGAFQPRYQVEGEALARYHEIADADPQARVLESARASKDPEIRKSIPGISKGIYDRTTDQMVREGALTHEGVEYNFMNGAKAKLDVFLNKVEHGMAAAQELIKKGSMLEKRKGRRWLKEAEKLKEEVEYAKTHWGEDNLMDTTLSMRKELDAQYDRERAAGYNLRYDDNYLPGRYDAEFFNDNSISFAGIRLLGRQFRAPKTFATYYDAIRAGPYVSATRDGAAIVGSRVRQGMKQVNKKLWENNLKNIVDPETHRPVVRDPVKRPDGSFAPPDPEHELVYARPGYDPIAVRKGFAPLLRNLTGQSSLQDWAPSRFALQTAQQAKHALLLFDLFHLGRLKYYDWSISGLGKGGYSKGLSVLEYRPQDFNKAIQAGVLTPESVNWAMESIPIKLANRTVNMTRYEVGNAIIKHGLNVGRIQDAIYKDLVANWPIIGKYNKWLFDKFTRGVMLQTAVHEFERINKESPGTDSRTLMRDISKDLNNYFGSLGRQGWIKNPTIADLPRIVGLAPQWVEGLVKKEATLYSRASGASKLFGREGVPYMGVVGRGLTRGLASMVVLTQVINMITRRQPTWKNEEEGHKFDAWIPSFDGSGDGFWLSPLAIFNELTHDVVRLSQTKPKIWDAITQIGENKLGPWGKAMRVLATGETPTHQTITSTGGVLAEAAKQMIPVPISIGKLAQSGLHKLMPGVVPPTPPGSAQRQAFSSLGIKIEPAQSETQQMMQKADTFMRKEGLRKGTGFDLKPNDEASYSKLRGLIRSGNTNGGKKMLNELRKTRTDDQIIKGMDMWAKRPFTGSEDNEVFLIDSLNDKELDMYQRAMIKKQKELDAFYDFMVSQGTP